MPPDAIRDEVEMTQTTQQQTPSFGVATYTLGLEGTNGLVANWQRLGLIALAVGQFENMSIS